MEDSTSPERIVKWLAYIATPLRTIAIRHQGFYHLLYPQLRSGYDSAGCPLGGREQDMWRWWQGRARRERARWLARQRRAARGERPS